MFSRNFHLCVRTCCHIIATSPQTICHHHRDQHIPLPFNHIHLAPQTSIATIEIICPSWLKSPPPLRVSNAPCYGGQSPGSVLVDFWRWLRGRRRCGSTRVYNSSVQCKSIRSFLAPYMNSYVTNSFLNTNI